VDLKNLKELPTSPTLAPLTELEQAQQALDNTKHWLNNLISPFLRIRRKDEERKRQEKGS
jgi:hypothetical protein